MLKLAKRLTGKLPSIDGKMVKDYCKNLGLACVIGGLTGFFLKTHTSHQTISLSFLCLIGSLFSYIGILKGDVMIELIAPYIGMGMVLIFVLFIWTVSNIQEKERQKQRHRKKLVIIERMRQ